MNLEASGQSSKQTYLTEAYLSNIYFKENINDVLTSPISVPQWDIKL